MRDELGVGCDLFPRHRGGRHVVGRGEDEAVDSEADS